MASGITGRRLRRAESIERRAWPGLLSRAPGRSDAGPEIGEFDGVEEGHDVDYFFVLHSHVPRVGVLVRFAVEECDDHVAVGVEGADGGDETLRHARAEWSDDLVDEFFFAVVGARHGRVADDRPFRVVGEDVEEAAGAGDPFVEAGSDDLLVARFDGVSVASHVFLSFPGSMSRRPGSTLLCSVLPRVRFGKAGDAAMRHEPTLPGLRPRRFP